MTITAEPRTGRPARTVLVTLAAGQFLTLDSSVMNDAIATVAKDVGTRVTGIQSAITLYTLVMAMLDVNKKVPVTGLRAAVAVLAPIALVALFFTRPIPTLPVGQSSAQGQER
jgi:hypothetical protein